MPRISTEQSELVRQRVVDGALGAFIERGVHEATMQDVVRHSGLSVGAIYTYFVGKDELIVAVCELALDRELAALAGQMGSAATVRRKLDIAVAFWFDFIDRDPAQARLMAQLWAEAFDDGSLRQMLARRRERLVGVAAVLIQEAIARGELRAGPDYDALMRGFQALLDGMLLQRLEAGDAFRRPVAERRAMAWIDLLFAAGAA